MRYLTVLLAATLVFLSAGNTTSNAQNAYHKNPQGLMEVQRAYTFQTNGGDKGIITFAKDGILSVTITNGWVDSGVWRTEG